MKELILLVDTVMVKSPGMLHLQHEVIKAIIRNCPVNSKVILIKNEQQENIKANTILIENIREKRQNWFGRWLWCNEELPEKINRYNANVLYSMSGIVSSSMTKLCGTISTVNNMQPFQNNKIGYYIPFSRYHLRLYLLRQIYKKSCNKADALIFHSEHALKTMSRYVKGISGKSYVVLTGIPNYKSINNFAKNDHPYAGKPYLFYLSAIYRYKNQLNLIEAYKRALYRNTNLPDLIIAGYPVDKPYVRKMIKAIALSGVKDKIKYINSVSQNEVFSWLHYAAVNIFPSTCETNSIVQSEILAANGVMACSDVPPMPEIAGNAAMYFDPFNPDSIADVILRLCGDARLQDELRFHAEKRAKQLSWDDCGKTVWKAAEKAHENYMKKKRIS